MIRRLCLPPSANIRWFGSPAQNNQQRNMTDHQGVGNEVIDLQKISNIPDKKNKIDPDDEEINLEDAIELAGFGRWHMGLILFCAACLILMISEAMGISIVLPAAQCDLALTTTDKGYLSGVTYLGMVVSAHAWGFCADTYGRKKVLMVSAAGTWLSSVTSSFAPTAGIFIAFRFLTGLFLCGNSSTMYAYLSEFLPASNRSRIMTWTCGFLAIGYLLVPGVAWILLPQDIRLDLGFVVFTSWRLFLIVMGIFSFIVGFAMIYFPESPKFLMSVGRKQEALEVLRSIYALNFGDNVNAYPVKNLKYENVGEVEENIDDNQNANSPKPSAPKRFAKIIWRQTVPLFQSPYGFKTLLFCTLQFGLYITSGGLYLWLPNLLNMMTLSDDLPVGQTPPETMCEFVALRQGEMARNSSTLTMNCSNVIRSEVYMTAIAIGVSYGLSYALYGGFVSLFGKRNVVVSALMFSGAMGIGSYFARDQITLSFLLCGFVVLSGTCISVLSAIIVDVYPTNLRAMAVSLSLTSGRLSSGLTGNVIGILFEYDCDSTIIGLGCITLSCALLCLLLPK